MSEAAIVSISESAREYLAELLAKQDCEGIGVRMYVSSPGTSRAETCLAYNRPGEEKEDDLEVDYGQFKAYFEKKSLPYLEEATVDYAADKFGGQLTIKAPNSKAPRVRDDSPVDEKVVYWLHAEINPQLASHGGEVTLETMDGMVAVLRFGGGCQGCSSVDITLKQGVEKTLMEKVPELTGVRDVTDHSDRSQAYY